MKAILQNLPGKPKLDYIVFVCLLFYAHCALYKDHAFRIPQNTPITLRQVDVNNGG